MIKILKGVIKQLDTNKFGIQYVSWSGITASGKEAIILDNQQDFASKNVESNVTFMEKDGIAKIITNEEIIKSIKFE